MKVLSFLEVHQLGIEEQVEYVNYLTNNFKLENRFADFYSQDFKPDLITEFFASMRIEGHFIGDTDNIQPDYYDYALSNKLSRIVYDKNPRTLDDFITDCQRAGIKLKWRTK